MFVTCGPFRGERPPAALFYYSPDRKGECLRAHLKNFRGVIHADGYAGFNELFAGGTIIEAACWVHVRRKLCYVFSWEPAGGPKWEATRAVAAAAAPSHLLDSGPGHPGPIAKCASPPRYTQSVNRR